MTIYEIKQKHTNIQPYIQLKNEPKEYERMDD